MTGENSDQPNMSNVQSAKKVGGIPVYSTEIKPVFKHMLIQEKH